VTHADFTFAFSAVPAEIHGGRDVAAEVPEALKRITRRVAIGLTLIPCHGWPVSQGGPERRRRS